MEITKDFDVEERYYFKQKNTEIGVNHIKYTRNFNTKRGIEERLYLFFNNSSSFLVIENNQNKIRISPETQKYMDITEKVFKEMSQNDKSDLLDSLSEEAKRLLIPINRLIYSAEKLSI